MTNRACGSGVWAGQPHACDVLALAETSTYLLTSFESGNELETSASFRMNQVTITGLQGPDPRFTGPSGQL